MHVLVVDSWITLVCSNCWPLELLKPPCNVNWGTNSNEQELIAALFQHHVLSQQMILRPIQESFYFCPDLQLESFGLPPSRAQHLLREQELPDVRARDLWIIYISSLINLFESNYIVRQLIEITCGYHNE